MTTRATITDVSEPCDLDFKAAVMGDIEELKSLQSNWDQFGAPQIHAEAIASALAFAARLPTLIAIRPEVVPLPSGNLQFEWCAGSKSLELEFEKDSTIRFLKWDSDRGIDEEDTILATDLERASELIHWFISGS